MPNTHVVEPDKEVMRAVVELIRNKEFYGYILQQLDKKFTSTVPGMALGKRESEMLVKLTVNPDWVRDLFQRHTTAKGDTDPAWATLGAHLEHNVLHMVFDHLTLDMSDRVRSAVACDLAVNSHIGDEAMDEEFLKPSDYGLESGMSALAYYGALAENETFLRQRQSEHFVIQVANHSMWEGARSDPILGEFVRDVVRQAQDLCDGSYGDIPGAVVEMLRDFLVPEKPKVPWNRLLRLFCASATESTLDYTMSRKSKRFGTRPGIRKHDRLNLAVAVDTSGSISDDQLEMFFGEIHWIWRNGSKVTIYEADAHVCAVYPYTGSFEGEVHGRGGTNLEPVLMDVEGKFDALIYFTDFYAPEIKTRYQIPTLWVLTTELSEGEYPYPWGKHIRLDPEDVP